MWESEAHIAMPARELVFDFAAGLLNRAAVLERARLRRRLHARKQAIPASSSSTGNCKAVNDAHATGQAIRS